MAESTFISFKIYKFTKKFPSEERFGIVMQLRKSASSIATNIVEGHKKNSRKDFLHFLNTADASLEETKYHLILSKDLGYIRSQDFNKLSAECDEVGRILFGFQKGLKT